MNLASDFGATFYTGPQAPPPPDMAPESQIRANISRTPVKQPMTGMSYSHMMPYGPMGRVSPMMGIPTSPQMMQMQAPAALMGMSPYMNFGFPPGGAQSAGVGLQSSGKKILPPSNYITVRGCLHIVITIIVRLFLSSLKNFGGT